MRRASVRRFGAFAATVTVAIGALSPGLTSAATSGFRDVGGLSALARTAIQSVAKAGIMTGTAPGKFNPSGLVTRAQAVKFAVNLANLTLEYPRSADFPDISQASVYYPYVETALADGLLSGVSGASTGSRFDPSADITRTDLAALLTNALGDQTLAQSFASDAAAYPRLTDLASVPSADLGAVIAMMKAGVVPPYTSARYAPAVKVNREQMAVALYRGTIQLAASAPGSVTLTPSSPTVGANTTDPLTLVVKDAAGTVMTSLTGYSVAYALTGANASQANVTGAGIFSASAPGEYTVTATVSGGRLKAPLTATAIVEVFGGATALRVTAATPTIVADGNATDKISVEAVDEAGNLSASYTGPVTLTDSDLGTAIETATGGHADTVTTDAVGGVATFTLVSTNGTPGLTDTIAATNPNGTPSLAEGTVTIQTVAQQATSVAVSFAQKVMEANLPQTATASVTVLDQAGYPMLTGVYPLTLGISGPGTFAQSATTASSTFFGNGSLTAASPATVTVDDIQGRTGTIVVQATASGLAGGTASLPVVIAGSPVAFAVTDATPTFAEGSAGTVVTIQSTDASGYPVEDPDYAVMLNVTTASGAEATSIEINGAALVAGPSGDLISLNAAGGAQVTLTDTNAGADAGSYVVTATPIAQAKVPMATGKLTVTETAGAAHTLQVTSNAIYVPTSAPDAQITAQIVDAYGNPVADVGAPITFTAVAPGTIANSGVNSTTVTASGSGAATVTVTLPAISGSVTTVTASSQGLGAGSSPGIQAESVVASKATLAFEDLTPTSTDFHSATTATAGDTVQATVSLTDALGAAVTTPDQLAITISPAGALVPTGATATGAPGSYVWNYAAGGLLDLKAEAVGTATVTVKDLSVANGPTATAGVAVVAGSAVSGYAFFNGNTEVTGSSPLVIPASEANTPVELSVSPVDAEGNRIPATASVYLVPASSPSGASFRATASGADLTTSDPLEIPVGSIGTAVYIVAPAGSYTVSYTVVTTP